MPEITITTTISSKQAKYLSTLLSQAANHAKKKDELVTIRISEMDIQINVENKAFM